MTSTGKRISWRGAEAKDEQSDGPAEPSTPTPPQSPSIVRRHSKSASLSHARRKPSHSPEHSNTLEIPQSEDASTSAESSDEEVDHTERISEKPPSLQELGRKSSMPLPLSTSLPAPTCSTVSDILAKSPTFTPNNVQRFTTIASGHSDFFKLGDDKLAKPCNPHEAKVYAALSDCTVLHPFVAKFHGFMSSPTSSSLSVKSRGKQDADQFIVLQDLTHGFTHPCVMDLKMGTSQSTRSQSAAKRRWRSAKVTATTSAKLGVRLGGIRVYKPYLKEWVIRKGNYGKRLTETTFMDALTLFFNDGCRTRLELISCFIKRLKAFQAAMEVARVDFDFIASSVLLIYEGSYDRSSLHEENCAPPRIDVRLIDFDHTVIKADSPDSKNDDSGAIIGIRKLIYTLETLLYSHTRTHSFTELPDVKLTAVVQEVKQVADSDEKLLKLMPAQPKKEFPRLRRINSQP